MKPIISAAVIAISIVTTAQAILADNLSVNDHCLSVSSAAMTVMEIRQSYNFSLGLVLEAVAGDPIIEYLVLEAYDVPKHSKEEHQLEATAQFGKRMLTECLGIE